MSLTALNWPLLVSLIGLLALVMFQQRPRSSRREQLTLETSLARIGDVEPQPLSRSRKGAGGNPAAARRSSVGTGRGSGRTLIVPAVVFLFIAGIGAAIFHFGNAPAKTDPEPSHALASSDLEDEALARLTDFTRAIEAEAPASGPGGDQPLPDVNTMIERLAARLKTSPGDIKGWRMLGWSYFHTGRYEEAATAYAKAIEVDPSSAELRLEYGEAKAKAAGGDTLNMASSSPRVAADKGGDGQGAGTRADPATMSPRERDAAIRSMVDGLANRLKSDPRDIEGWSRLMRSRVVLGERGLALEAFREALVVFKQDAAATGKITAAAIELGLKDE